MITNNFISNASANSLPSTLISALNFESGALNDGVRITDNILSNYSGNGVQVSEGNGSNWSISNNTFFYDANATPTTLQTAIDFQPGTASTGSTISGNIIGGRSVTGTPWIVDQEEGKQGLRYYRLRQEDHDGTTSYYGPATVSFQDEVSTQLAAYPTSFEQQLTVEMTIPAATPVAFTLTDAVGRVVWQKTETLAAGFTQLQVAPQCPAGTYVLTARLNGTVLRQRVVRQ